MLKGLTTSLAIFLTSCSTTVDESEVLPMWGNEAEQVCYAISCPPPKSTALAIILTDEILKSWGLQHTENFERVTVTWYDPSDRIAGLTPDMDEVEIYDRTPGDVRDSALGHELIHVALWEQYGDPDYEHTDILFDSNDGMISAEQDIREAVIEHGI